jgi:Mlc titration factor MtfA (ptsG expression regulator)
MIPWGQNARRERLVQSPWPLAWNSILAKTVHAWVLTAEQLTKWRQIIRILVAEKNWEGCDGFTVTDEVKVTIASQAALTILEMPHDYFERVRSIVIFPSEFDLPLKDWQVAPTIVHGLAAHEAVFLAWDRVLVESHNASSGKNLVIHEFAHHLDLQDGHWNGCPDLRTKDQQAQWHEAMKNAFAELNHDLEKGYHTPLFGHNAATNLTEFFAEVSERFFTVPLKLQHFSPKVCSVLEEYYGLKTTDWFDGQ